jgi:hypothetical protein
MLTDLSSLMSTRIAWTFPLALLIVVVTLLIFTPIIRWGRQRRYAITEAARDQTDRSAIAREFNVSEVQSDDTSIAAALEALNPHVFRRGVCLAREPTICVAAPAVLNAYAKATGRRIRTVPLRNQRIQMA